MKIRKIDHVGIIVNDLAAAKAFFVDFGLQVQDEWELEGAWVDQVTGLQGVKTASVMLRTSDGETAIELSQFYTPRDENGIQPPSANTLGIRHIAFVVEDIDGLVARLEPKGFKPFHAVYRYENIYKMCYFRGPEGIILELAEELQ